MQQLLTFEARRLGYVKGRVSPSDGVLGIAAIWLHHLVKGGDAVAGLELGHVSADLVDDAGNVVALVDDNIGLPHGNLPVLGVRAANDNLDPDLVIVGFWDGRVDDLDLGTCGRLLPSTAS